MNNENIPEIAGNRYSNGFTYVKTKEPTRFEKGPFSKGIQTQGEITANRSVSGNLARNRLNSIKNNQPQNRLGTVVSDELDIYPGELTFAKNLNTSGPTKFNSGYTGVFTAFNAEETGCPQEEFEDRFFFAGIAKNVVQVSGGKARNNSGVATMVRGSVTIMNNGLDDFAPGDVITWGLRNVDSVIREKEEQNLPRIKATPKNKYLAVLKKLDYSQITNVITEAYYTVFDDFNIDQLDLYRPGSNKKYSHKQELGIAFRTADLTKGFLFLATLRQKGLITINTPNDPLSVSGYKKYDSYIGKELSEFDQALSEKNDDGSLEKRSLTKNDDEQLMYLAYKLGLLKADSYEAHLTPSKELIIDLVARMNAGHIAPREERNYFSIANAFSNITSKRKRSSNGNDMITKLENLQSDIGRRQATAYKLAGNSTDAKVIGISSSNSVPGGKIDIYM